MTTSPTTQARSRRGVAVAGAVGAGLAVWVIAVPVLGVDLAARVGDGELVVGAPAIALAGLVAALAGWSLLALLERVTSRARGLWLTVAVTAFVISLAGPLVQATTVATGAVLVTMHVAVGTTIIVALRSTARSVPPSERPRALRPRTGR